MTPDISAACGRPPPNLIDNQIQTLLFTLSEKDFFPTPGIYFFPGEIRKKIKGLALTNIQY
jgi:hypothetical protein